MEQKEQEMTIWDFLDQHDKLDKEGWRPYYLGKAVYAFDNSVTDSEKVVVVVYTGEKEEVDRRHIMAPSYRLFLWYCHKSQIPRSQAYWIDRYEKALSVVGTVEVLIGDTWGSFSAYNGEMMRAWERLSRSPRVTIKYVTLS